MITKISIDGLAPFAKALRKINGELPKLLRSAMNKAARVIVNYGKSEIPKRTGHAASTIKPRSTRTAVRVVEGSKRYPYVPWLDFGGAVGPKKSVKRPWNSEGTYLYPALRIKRDEIERSLVDALTEFVDQAGLS